MAKVFRQSYYITPTRLTKNPHLWKTIGMMKTLNKDSVIECPVATDYWVKENWHTLTPGNLNLVFEYSERVYIHWAEHPETAAKSFDHLLKVSGVSNIVEVALSAQETPEESINEFIKDRLPSLLDRPPTYSYKDKTLGGATCVSAILRNRSIKMYQIQNLWQVISSRDKPHEILNMIDHTPLSDLPDAILKKFLSFALKTGIEERVAFTRVISEAYKRKMVVVNPTPVEIIPMAQAPIAQLVAVEEQPRKLIPMVPGKVYRV